MRRLFSVFLCGVFCAAGIFPNSTLLASQNLPVQLDTNAPVEVTMDSFYDEAPPGGFAPILITLRNRTSSAQEFRLNYQHGGFSRYNSSYTSKGSATIHVDAMGRSQTYVYIPILSNERYGISVNISGPGIRDGNNHVRSHDYSSTGGFTGLGEQTAITFKATIEEALKKASASSSSSALEISGTRITPSAAPADWRAYAAFTSIWLSPSEWGDLDPGARTAITEWVGMGGILYFLTTSPNQRAALTIPGAQTTENNDIKTLGFGKINYIAYADTTSGKEAFVEKAAKIIAAEIPASYLLQGDNGYSSRANNNSAGYRSKWELDNLVPSISRNVTTLSIFMILFAIAIGPVNFFVLAPSQRRYRILWTTPLIAITASILLGLIILLGDGTGGQGARLTVACFLPEQKRLLVKQEQASITGLLLGNSFSFSPNELLMPISLRDERRQGLCTQSAEGWSGDWFASRARQAQFASTVRATRGGIKVTLPSEKDPGSVHTSFEMPLAEIYIVSADGTSAYKATHLATGARRPLEKIPVAEFLAWQQQYIDMAGPLIKADLKTLEGCNGYFIARAAKATDLALSTLTSIDWKNDTAIIVGPVEFENK